MNWFLLISSSFIIGFLTAIPIGATHVEIAKRSISGYINSALMLILGAIIADLLYGFISLYGIAPFLQYRYVEAIFCFTAAITLSILGVLTIIHSDKPSYGYSERTIFKSNSSFFIGFSINTTNPSMLFWWPFCFEFLKSIGIIHTTVDYVKTTFVVIGSLGMGIYFILFAIFLKKKGNFIVKKYESKINKALGILLVCFSVYFIVKAFLLGYIYLR